MFLFRGEINRAAKSIEHAPILMRAAQRDEPLVKALRASFTKIAHPLNPEVHEILRKARADAGNPLKLAQCRRIAHHVPTDRRGRSHLLVATLREPK